MTPDGKVTAAVWGGQLDGHTFSERPPAFRSAIQRRLTDADWVGTPEYATFELLLWDDGGHRWVPAEIAERIRQADA